MRTVTQLASSAAAHPPPGRSTPEASAAPFAAVLDTHQARTAVAEGHTPKRPTGAQDQPRTTPDARGIAPRQDRLERARLRLSRDERSRVARRAIDEDARAAHRNSFVFRDYFILRDERKHHILALSPPVPRDIVPITLYKRATCELC